MMRALLCTIVACFALTLPLRSDVLLPGQRSIPHKLVILPSENWAGKHIVAGPTRGFGGAHVVEPGVPFEFSTKYGTRLYVVAQSEPIPQSLDEAWKAAHLSAEIPVTEISSVSVSSPVESVLTTLSIARWTDSNLELSVTSQVSRINRWVLGAMAGAAVLGLCGFALVLRRRRRAEQAARALGRPAAS